MAVKAKYLEAPYEEGKPYFNGVPARDLEESEFDALSPEDQELVAGSDLYRMVGSGARVSSSQPRGPAPLAEMEPAPEATAGG